MNIKLIKMQNRVDLLKKRNAVVNANIIRKLQRNIKRMEKHS